MPCVKSTSRSLPDTNTIIRYLVVDEPALAAKATLFFDGVKNGAAKAVILESVVAECVYVLTKTYRVPKERAASSLIDLLRYKGVVNEDRNELIEALSLFSNRNLDIVDCILLAKSVSRGDDLFTFDTDLSKHARHK